jgi:hypothetical protein
LDTFDAIYQRRAVKGFEPSRGFPDEAAARAGKWDRASLERSFDHRPA